MIAEWTGERGEASPAANGRVGEEELSPATNGNGRVVRSSTASPAPRMEMGAMIRRMRIGPPERSGSGEPFLFFFGRAASSFRICRSPPASPSPAPRIDRGPYMRSIEDPYRSIMRGRRPRGVLPREWRAAAPPPGAGAGAGRGGGRRAGALLHNDNNMGDPYRPPA